MRPRLLKAMVAASAILLAANSHAAAQGAAPAAAPRPAAPMMGDPYEGQKKLLVIADVQSGFHHDSINHAMGVIEQMGRETGAYVAFLRTDSQLITRDPIVGVGTRYGGRGVNARNLDYFDAIFFLGSGEGTLNEKQKQDLLAFVHEDGKGFIGGHASIVAFYDWPEYLDMVGGYMAGEWRVEPTGIIVEDPAFPGAAALPDTLTDQFPWLGAPYEPGNFRTIVRLDPSRLTPEQRARRPDGNFPVAWAKDYGKGRVFVSSLGHTDTLWDVPAVRTFYLEAIKWALGMTEADVTPDAQK